MGSRTAVTATPGAGAEGRRLAVLGLGNVLCSDDGVGPAAVAELWRRYRPPASATVVDGGTLGMVLMPVLEAVDDAILVDAVLLDGEPPGAPVRLLGDDIPAAVLHRLSPHQVGVADLLDGLRLLGRTPPRMTLLGLVPASLALGMERTPAVAAALPALVDRVVAEAARLGHRFEPRDAGRRDTGPRDTGPRDTRPRAAGPRSHHPAEADHEPAADRAPEDGAPEEPAPEDPAPDDPPHPLGLFHDLVGHDLGL